jgi:glycosyltransferase involved in cell wall biosynthesis
VSAASGVGDGEVVIAASGGNERDASNAGSVGVVVIGRNEGERFRRCVASLVADTQHTADDKAGHRAQSGAAAQRIVIVYVDSGSTDGSQQFARDAGVEVVDLDMTTPFTAARARNAGLSRLLAIAPATAYVQFVDGDCEVHANWLNAGATALAREDTLAAVSGRLRERFPQHSLYNKLADIEWDRPVGLEKSCGGNAMFRVKALTQAGGYDATLIAGEEPELCARLRQHGWLIRRIADDMALHDLAMFTQRQWLTRATRHGFAMLEVSRFRTHASRGLFSQQMRSALIWGLAVPAMMWTFVVSVVLCLAMGGVYWLLGSLAPVASQDPQPSERVLEWFAFVSTAAVIIFVLPALLLALLTIAQWLRLAARAKRDKPLTWREALLYSRLLLASKSANVRGMAQMLRRRWNKGPATLIDYKVTGETTTDYKTQRAVP